MDDRLIVALDYTDLDAARKLIIKLDDLVSFYKVGWATFMTGGIAFVQELRDRGKKVFLDLKMDDIPEQVRMTVEAISRLEVEFFTLQGDYETFQAAKEGRGTNPYPRAFLHVPLISSRLANPYDVEARREFERMVSDGIDGLVASGNMISMTRGYFGSNPNLVIVAPGIRRRGQEYHDHRRHMQPQQALKAGANHLVVGRSIRTARDPREEVLNILDEIDRA